MFNKHKGEYHCTIYFIIAAVNIVSSLTVPCYFSLFYIDHKVIFCVEIIALFQYSLPYSQISCPYCWWYSNLLSIVISKHKGKIYRNTVPSHRMSSLYSILITRSSYASESLHYFNTHSHIHKFIILIAGATLLNFIIFTVNSFSWLFNTKVRYIVTPFRHIVCRLCIICTLASISTNTPWHKHAPCSY